MATAKKTTAKTTTKASTKKAAPKKDAGPQLSAKEKQDKAAERPIVWSDGRVAVVKALRKMKAFNATSGKTAAEIAKASNVDPVKVKIHCDVYRGGELAHPKRGIIVGVRMEGSRELVYYLTAKGRKCKID